MVDLNGAQACIRAGYSRKAAKESASRLLTKAHIAKRIVELQDEYRQRSFISFDWVVCELLRVIDVAYERKNVNAAIRAIQELAKLHGLYDVHKGQSGINFPIPQQKN